MARQLSLFSRKNSAHANALARSEHGGSTAQGRRKLARPLDPKRPLHVVLKSTRARGKWSLLHRTNDSRVSQLTYKTAQKHQMRVLKLANVGNHLHVLVRTPTRDAFQRFLRELAGRIAMTITGARKGRPMKGRFWDELAFSRVVNWGRDLDQLKLYFAKNFFEAAGLLTPAMKADGFELISLTTGTKTRKSRAGPPSRR